MSSVTVAWLLVLDGLLLSISETAEHLGISHKSLEFIQNGVKKKQPVSGSSMGESAMLGGQSRIVRFVQNDRKDTVMQMTALTHTHGEQKTSQNTQHEKP